MDTKATFPLRIAFGFEWTREVIRQSENAEGMSITTILDARAARQPSAASALDDRGGQSGDQSGGLRIQQGLLEIGIRS